METENKFFGYNIEQFVHGNKGVLKFEGKWMECAVSIETNEEGTTYVHLCTDEKYLKGRGAKEKFGYEYSLVIVQKYKDGKIFIYEEEEDITHFFFLGGEKAEPSLKKHWKFIADGIGLKIHDLVTDEQICNAVHSDGVLADRVEEILTSYGYDVYNFTFNERGQMIFPFGD